MKQSKTRRIKLIDKMLSVPEEVASDQTKITILGFEEMLIENYSAILEYQDFYIRIKTKIGIININGFQMTINELNSDDMMVKGYIDSIDFESKEDAMKIQKRIWIIVIQKMR